MKGADKFRTKTYRQTEELALRDGGLQGDEYLAGVGRLLAQLESRLAAVSEEVAFNVEDLGAIDEGGDRGGRQMGLLELLRRAKSSNERAKKWNSAKGGVIK